MADDSMNFLYLGLLNDINLSDSDKSFIKYRFVEGLSLMDISKKISIDFDDLKKREEKLLHKFRNGGE